MVATAAPAAPARRGLPKLPPELAPPFTPPTEAERADMLASVDKLVRKVVNESKVRKADREDACQSVRMKLWEVSARFDPTGPAKWPTFATYVARIECRRFVGESCHSIGDALDFPVEELIGGLQAVTLTLAAGYGGAAAVPAAAAQAIRLAVGYWYEHRGDGRDPTTWASSAVLAGELGLPAAATRLLGLLRDREYR